MAAIERGSEQLGSYEFEFVLDMFSGKGAEVCLTLHLQDPHQVCQWGQNHVQTDFMWQGTGLDSSVLILILTQR